MSHTWPPNNYFSLSCSLMGGQDVWDTACRLPLPFSLFIFSGSWPDHYNSSFFCVVRSPRKYRKRKKESLLGLSPPNAHANKLAVKEMTKKWVEGFSFFLLHFICWPSKTSVTFGASIMNCGKRKTWHRESRNASSEVTEGKWAVKVVTRSAVSLVL